MHGGSAKCRCGSSLALLIVLDGNDGGVLIGTTAANRYHINQDDYCRAISANAEVQIPHRRRCAVYVAIARIVFTYRQVQSISRSIAIHDRESIVELLIRNEMLP